MVSIIRAKENDFRDIVRIGKSAVTEAHQDSCSAEDLDDYMSRNYCDDAIKTELANTGNIYHIIIYNGEPVGFSKIVLNAEHPNIPAANTTKLDRIYLLKEFFGQKLGAQLLNFNKAYAKNHGQTGIWLFTWTGNNRAVDFYLKAGFEVIGSHLFRVSETHSNPNHHMFLKL